jgi:sulfur dioxygenase
MIGGEVDKDEFINRVDAMDLALPKKIHVAVPSNQICGSRIITN